jgi:hypothetical protein
MRNATQKHSEREALMRTLASRLEFSVEKAGARFTLLRTADVMPPVYEERLTLNQAEELLQTWKLRGRG